MLLKAAGSTTGVNIHVWDTFNGIAAKREKLPIRKKAGARVYRSDCRQDAEGTTKFMLMD
ncbi:hypothetical protein NLN84_03265 [Citrobacter portucalensis]|uniref:hypothetical protein n=1 Tax=Citrobacter portucalensis TaxID=1639133 RepID=UPI00226BB2DF|nr:hypothetical protein [Citrobacter portucalensis]MCX9064605.1 hypothetical protein [Citrobacter portucalensis]